ncbi:MAG: RNA 2'-phosphotransferase [Candidatus Bathyarchaeota archaeon]
MKNEYTKVATHGLKVRVSKYISYLLRHNPYGLQMDKHGFVSFDELFELVRTRFHINKKLIHDIVAGSNRRRYEIVEDRIRALYGHSIPVQLELPEDKVVKILYHGTTEEAVDQILRFGLKPMKRRWVHLSPTKEIAKDVGLRRTNRPIILQINAVHARKNGVKFYKATDKVHLCKHVNPEMIKVCS